MKHVLGRFVAGLALVALSACGGDSVTAPNQVSFAGTFTLRTVNGGQLPYVLLQSGQASLALNADQITIADGGTWSEVQTVHVVQNGQSSTQTQTDGGTWLRSGSSIVFHSDQFANTAYSGTFSNTQLTLTDGLLLSYVFAK